MTKYVHETAAGKSIKAICILKGSKVVAHVVAAYANSGGVLVNATQHGDAAKRSYKTALKRDPKIKVDYPEDGLTFQMGRAGGYGYDKFTAAISGFVIDGHEITNHCGKRWPLPQGKKVFPRDFKAPKGYHMANYVSKSSSMYDGAEGYTDCYRQSGFDYLRDIGYTVETIL
jgi:hypothetical protein